MNNADIQDEDLLKSYLNLFSSLDENIQKLTLTQFYNEMFINNELDSKKCSLSLLKLMLLVVGKKDFNEIIRLKLAWLFEMLVNDDEQAIRQAAEQILEKVLMQNEIQNIKILEELLRNSVKTLQLGCINIFRLIIRLNVDPDIKFIKGTFEILSTF